MMLMLSQWVDFTSERLENILDLGDTFIWEYVYFPKKFPQKDGVKKWKMFYDVKGSSK